MSVILIIFSFLFSGTFCFDPRIIGGTVVRDRSDFAYQALLLFKGAPFCGGTIIDNRHVLTAGHCGRPYENSDEQLRESDVSVVVGNLRLYDYSNVKDVIFIAVHEEFDKRSIFNDIGIFRIAGTFEFNQNVQPIDLRTDYITSGICNVSGWGYTVEESGIMSPNLLYVEVPIIDRDTCNATYFPRFGPIDKNQICAGLPNKDACQGDSGGPLVCSGRLTGIVSNGFRCGYLNYAGIYTEVAKYLDWIEATKKKTVNKGVSLFSAKYGFLLFLQLMIFGSIRRK